MIFDLRDNETDHIIVKQYADKLIESNKMNEEKSRQILENVKILEQKWTKLKKCVENRINISSKYLEYVKHVNELRNCALDIQELINTFNDFSPNTASTSESIYEKHIKDKIKIFESFYANVLSLGNLLLNEFKKVVLINYIL